MPKFSWNPFSKGGMPTQVFEGSRKVMEPFLFGSPEKHKRVSTLLPEQQALYEQLVGAGMEPGAGGAFGTAADYYRNLLSDDPNDLNAMAAPEMRRFNEDIIPGLSEQFAGMGSGALSSSGFRNAAVSAGTDLSERIAAMRANLRQQGASGLTNIGQMGLNNFSQDVMTQPGTQGILPGLANTAGNVIGQVATAGANNYFKGANSAPVGRNSSPYGGGSTQGGFGGGYKPSPAMSTPYLPGRSF